jgi:hypothetical protein
MSIRIRAYNVLFGDALLLSWDEDDGLHHAFVDFGNFHNDANTVFEAVYHDVLARTKGHLDLVVITHRHLDHLEGFYSLRQRFAEDFTIGALWHAHVTATLDSRFELAGQALAQVMPIAVQTDPGEIGCIYRNNFGASGVSTKDRMDEIADAWSDAIRDGVFAVHRETRVADVLPSGIRRLKVEILAPEKDSGVYLEPLDQALAARTGALRGAFERAAGRKDAGGEGPFGFRQGMPAARSPLAGLADFARLRRKMRTGGLDLLAAADRTRNNTSVVLKLTYDGQVKFLLAGDAEEKSWEILLRQDARRTKKKLSSDLIKIGHHGSINASPSGCFEAVLPGRLRRNAAVLSTDPSRFTGTNEVPKGSVLTGWRGRLTSASRLKRTDRVALGKSVTFLFET